MILTSKLGKRWLLERHAAYANKDAAVEKALGLKASKFQDVAREYVKEWISPVSPLETCQALYL
jgi:hypothetical protein